MRMDPNTMVIRVTDLCRGDGKGYIKISSDCSMGKISALAESSNGTAIFCPVYSIGFPGEDEIAQRHMGKEPEVDSRIIAVPLLDKASLTVRVHAAGNSEPILGIPFIPLATKIRSRLTYRLHAETAYQMRGIDQRRLSGNTYVSGAGCT